MSKPGDQVSPDDSLGAHLTRLRNATGLSLRQVEEATKKEVSNAYLSQLENNKIVKPSPNILHALSVVYTTSYEDLMRRAGYVSSDADASGHAQKRPPLRSRISLPKKKRPYLIIWRFIRNQKRK